MSTAAAPAWNQGDIASASPTIVSRVRGGVDTKPGRAARRADELTGVLPGRGEGDGRTDPGLAYGAPGRRTGHDAREPVFPCKGGPRYAAFPHRRPALRPSRPCTHVGVSPRELDASRVPGLVPTRYQACPGSPQRPDDPRTSNLSTQVPAMAPGASCAILRQVYGMVPPGTGPVCHMGACTIARTGRVGRLEGTARVCVDIHNLAMVAVASDDLGSNDGAAAIALPEAQAHNSGWRAARARAVRSWTRSRWATAASASSPTVRLGTARRAGTGRTRHGSRPSRRRSRG